MAVLDRLEIKAAFTANDAGEITGIAWVFDQPDRVGDVIEPGAFGTIPARVPMLFKHDPGQIIGVWESAVETDKGLEVKGRLFHDTIARAKEVYQFLREGLLSGLSIGFSVKSATGRKEGGRIIKSLSLAEVSIVSIPAHPGARIGSVKSRAPYDAARDDAARIDAARIVAALNRAASALST